MRRLADLLIDVGMDRTALRSKHQPRPRDIIPMMTPTSSAPAIVPRGLRRAILSNSDAKVLACSLAAEASPDPASVTPLVSTADLRGDRLSHAASGFCHLAA